MKFILVTIAFVSTLLGGCITTYRMSDFTPKEKFFQKINTDIAEREGFIVLTNDSTVSVDDGMLIENDSLFSVSPLYKITSVRFAKTEIAEINYDQRTDDATIVLMNNDVLKGKDIRTLHDSIFFEKIYKENQKNFVSLIQDVKKVGYKNRLIGTLTGIPGGFIVGGVLGYWLGKTTANNTDPGIMSDQHPTSEFEQRLVNLGGGAFAGFLLGGMG